ncbi:MAG: LPS export ABC transporter ATP-binding protein [Synergistaceae bacterium]|jgi:lipopolysaccharide export system ATP-binding protein|nr:LPS export ABC transporter ATP-binding protein [Synergistaceae bacterium]
MTTPDSRDRSKKVAFFRGEGLRKSFKKREVVCGADISVGPGEVVGLLGPNGAGKSTTFYMMVGRILPDFGSVFIEDDDVTSLPMYIRARRGVGYLPQEPSIFRRITVRENLDLVLAANGASPLECAERRDGLAEEFGLGHVMAAPGYALSGGERRRVEIARCLAADPAFILLDEPFSGIDPVAVYDLQEIIRRLKAKGYGILLTDHNVRETLAITDRTYIMHQGVVVVDGPPEKIANDPLAKKYYLGDRFEW